jgi:NTP pyrophosphatase (non-canonical NTP hydrolase)
MDFDEYQKKSRKTALYPDAGNNFVYPTLGLSGEAGEVAEKIKKVIRDKNGKIDQETKDIQKAIYFYCKCRNQEYMVSNKHLLRWFECDFLSITKSDFLTEFEIKQSRSDFRRDFTDKKVKHAWLEGKRATDLLIESDPSGKETVVESFSPNFIGSQQTIKMNDYIGPNYFYYVCPNSLIKFEEIPSYAGLIYVRENSTNTPSLSIIKKAPLLHKVKVTEDTKISILKRFMYDYWTNTYEKKR